MALVRTELMLWMVEVEQGYAKEEEDGKSWGGGDKQYSKASYILHNAGWMDEGEEA